MAKETAMVQEMMINLIQFIKNYLQGEISGKLVKI